MPDGTVANVPNDPTQGWSWGYGQTAVTFNGSWCAEMQAGDFASVSVYYNCSVFVGG
jgi:hypothetical protein